MFRPCPIQDALGTELASLRDRRIIPRPYTGISLPTRSRLTYAVNMVLFCGSENIPCMECKYKLVSTSQGLWKIAPN